ncbi:uncharacterized protein LOC124133338 [Haliotis rufescens]|uniref:uncharacterized protein LOC124133338 n=1 Tax=Haliotis rufescens TaxID=6454 RepID=UPI00201F1054|nr:uncharacterized protein LOC124133338 [Haliotis rufescens]
MVDVNIKDFLDAVKRGIDGRKLKQYLLVSKASDFRCWADDNGLDALHHTILLNNPEALQLILSEGYFAHPHEPKVNPYAHLAARLGFRTALSIILQFRPDDFRMVSGKFVIPGQDDDGDEGMNSPLDVAAKYDHIECVRTTLNMCVIKRYPEAASKDDVSLACLADSPLALELVLKQNPSKTDIKSGIEVSLQYARPDCLDILLKQGISTSSLFKQMNFYHVLYTYSQSFAKGGHSLLPKITSILINHGHSVKACKPPRTYPLYSLLSNAFCIHDNDNTQYYIQCMKLLLRKGADPCFDEVKDEAGQVKRGVKPVTGRHAFSSALHCLLETVEVFASVLESRTLAVKFVEGCADILGQYHAHANQIGRVGGNKSSLRGTVLHQYAKCSVVIGVDEAIMKCMLRHGADPNEKVNGKYAVNSYLDMLFEKLSLCQVVDTQHKYKKEVDTMLNICTFMSSTSVTESAKIFKNEHSRHLSQQVKPYVKYVREELDRRCHVIRSLRRLSAWKVWQLCGMKGSAVHALPVSVKIKTDILPIL